MGLAEERCAFLRVMPELITEDAEGAWGVAEAAGDIAGWLLIDEAGAEGFVLTLQRELRGKEEILVSRCRSAIRSAGVHVSIVLQKHLYVNMFGAGRMLLGHKNTGQHRNKPPMDTMRRFCNADRMALT
jgi:hypothetical protein